jgi:hypothetical protein
VFVDNCDLFAADFGFGCCVIVFCAFIRGLASFLVLMLVLAVLCNMLILDACRFAENRLREVAQLVIFCT